MVSDEELIKKFLLGNQNIYSEIIERYKAYVFAIILNFVKDPYETENIAQEVFLQLYRSLPKYKDKNLKAWIGRITTNKAIDWKRAMAKHLEEEKLDNEKVANLRDQGITNPEEILICQENKRKIHDICRNLPVIYSQVLIKFYFEGKSYQEIAEEENTPLKTIESRLYRARCLFRKKWRENA